ncbi:MAG: DUF167 domain-containing protein [Planctomycetaceae bacterium]|jgi:uncharacterized protein (TIGR00251 family)|nr:DUF167 domain-containing protein [Planctomycetaceae bacterium]
MLDYEIKPDAIIIPISAQPGAKRNEVSGVVAGTLRIRVTQIPEKGKANKEIQEQLADFLEVRKSQVELVVGETSRKKRFRVTGLDEKMLLEKIATLENT